MNLSAVPTTIVGSDLSCGVRLSGGLEEKIVPHKKETTVYVNRHCVFTWWKKARALNRVLSFA